MKTENFFLAMITLIVTLLVSLILAQIFNWNIFQTSNIGFKLVEYSLLTAVSLFCIKQLRIRSGLIIIILLVALKLLIIPQPNIINQLGSFWIYAGFSFSHFILFYLILFFFFQTQEVRALRNLLFSLAAGSSFAIIQIGFHLIAKIPISSALVLLYFRYGLIFMLGMSFSVSLSVQILSWLKKKFM